MQGMSRERRLLRVPPGHPARGRIFRRGRSPGSRVVAAVRPSRNRKGFSDLSWTAARRLQLRGQRRHYTGFPLSSGSSGTQRTSTTPIICTSGAASSIGTHCKSCKPANAGSACSCWFVTYQASAGAPYGKDGRGNSRDHGSRAAALVQGRAAAECGSRLLQPRQTAGQPVRVSSACDSRIGGASRSDRRLAMPRQRNPHIPQPIAAHVLINH
jgi:hypothetical protein